MTFPQPHVILKDRVLTGFWYTKGDTTAGVFLVYLFLYWQPIRQKGVRISIMIKINGHKYDYQEKKLLELLEEHGHRPEMVAVELNEEMVQREKFPETVFHDGDVVEIVMFMGGGAR